MISKNRCYAIILKDQITSKQNLIFHYDPYYLRVKLEKYAFYVMEIASRRQGYTVTFSLMKWRYDDENGNFKGEDYDVMCVECAEFTVCPVPCPNCPDVFFCSLK